MPDVATPDPRRPAWVPENLVVDFDVYAPSTDATDYLEACVDFQQHSVHRCVWSPRYNGHWLPTRGQDVFDIYADHARFSSRYFFIPATGDQGQLGALTLDPPDHQSFRTFLNKGMTPNIVATKKAFVRQLAVDLIAQFQDRDACEFISEFADILPLTVFLDLVELPFDAREDLGRWVAQTTREPDPAKRVVAMQDIAAWLTPFLAARRARPGADMLSAAANATINGRPVSAEEALGAAIHLMMAGLDTVSSMLGFVMIFLAQNPDHRQRLVAEPALIPRAANELIRRFPTVTMARQVREDLDDFGVLMKQGDMVAIPGAFYNLDADIYADPLTVDWSRRVKQTLTFGNGVHRCPGAALGLAELVIVLEEWLRVIPEFSIARPGPLPVCGGTVAKILELPLRFSA